MRRLNHRSRRPGLVAPALAGLAICLALIAPTSAAAEGSRDLYPENNPGYRANMEWRTTSYGPDNFLLRRRTLLKVYAKAGEYILVGSSAVGVPAPGPSNGDIRIYNPGAVSRDRNQIGKEALPELAPALNDPTRPGAFGNGFSCVTQRATASNGSRGRINNRRQELVGPNTDNDLVPLGFRPCFYQAPLDGIYAVAMYGPSGDGQNSETSPSGRVESTSADYTGKQDTSITSWDITVRASLNDTNDLRGRVFTYYFAGLVGENGRPVTGAGYIVTDDGFIYLAQYDGDPWGFILYANQYGFLNTDGTPLYRDVKAVSTMPFQDQNELRRLEGGVTLQPPQYPIFVSPPDPRVLNELGLPTTPTIPAISSLVFTGKLGDGSNVTLVGEGGAFSFTSTQPGAFSIVVSRDGQNFDPNNERNRVLRGILSQPGVVTMEWDGLDNSGNPFEANQEYLAKTGVQGGEVHFPFLDVENNPKGGPTLTLLNPPDRNGNGITDPDDCPPWNGGCRGAFYDDRGYRTANDVLVGQSVNGPLCPGNAANPRGFGSPPDPLYSDPLLGYDSRLPQRRFGFLSGGNPDTICIATSGFGDKKGLDLWTFYPSNVLQTPLRIIEPSAITLQSFSAAREAGNIVVRWSTGAERNTWGFHLYRSAGGRAGAVRITPRLVLALGRGGSGASYSWTDIGARLGEPYSYWLQEVELDGMAHEYGPARVAPLATGDTTVRLPLVPR